MGFLDDMLGLPQGTLDQTATDILGPAYTAAGQYAKDVWGIGGGSSSAAPSTPPFIGGSSGGEIYQHDLPILGGATMDWSTMGIPNGLSLTVGGPRRIMPYSGGMIPSGYRVAKRAARRPTSGYPAGVYLVPRRSMNPLNPRALLRAERRMGAFTHWVKRHFRIASSAPRRRKGGRFTKRRK